MPENNKDKNKKEEGSVKFEESPLDEYYNAPLRKEKSDLPDALGSVDFTYGNTDYGNSKYDEPNLRREDILDGTYKKLRWENQMDDLKNVSLIAVPFFLLALILFIRRKMRS